MTTSRDFLKLNYIKTFLSAERDLVLSQMPDEKSSLEYADKMIRRLAELSSIADDYVSRAEVDSLPVIRDIYAIFCTLNLALEKIAMMYLPRKELQVPEKRIPSERLRCVLVEAPLYKINIYPTTEAENAAANEHLAAVMRQYESHKAKIEGLQLAHPDCNFTPVITYMARLPEKVEKIRLRKNTYFDQLQAEQLQLSISENLSSTAKISMLGIMTEETISEHDETARIEAEFEFYYYNTVNLLPVSPDVKPKKIIAFDIDQTLLDFHASHALYMWDQPAYVYVQEKMLFRLLEKLLLIRDEILVVAVTSRNYGEPLEQGEDSSGYLSVYRFIKEIHERLGQTLFSQLFFTNAQYKSKVLLDLHCKYKGFDPLQRKDWIVFCDDRVDAYEECRVNGFPIVIAKPDGSHFTAVYEHVKSLCDSREQSIQLVSPVEESQMLMTGLSCGVG